MAEILPFKGLRYNLEKVGNYDNVIAPPYDVISKNMQDELYESSDYNIIRLIDNNSDGQGRYSQASDYFKQWQEDKVLVEDEEPAIYVYEQDFEINSQLLKRKGFIAALRLKSLEEGLIYPHERTMSKPKEDRLQLLKATEANLSPIFALYAEGSTLREALDKASSKEPDIDAVDSTGVRQKMWLLTDKDQIEIIQKGIKGKELFIADGHHRYETSLMYQELMGTDPRNPKTSDYTMVMFIDMDDEGVVIKPTHRIVDIGNMSFDELEKHLEDDFSSRECNSLDEVLSLLTEHKEKVVFGLSDGNKFYFLQYLGEQEFDLIVLHRELKRILEIKYSTVQDKIKFLADAEKALEQAKDGKVVFFVNPTPIETVKNMARSHQIMPQKSTYFYPKLTDGLVIRKL